MKAKKPILQSMAAAGAAEVLQANAAQNPLPGASTGAVPQVASTMPVVQSAPGTQPAAVQALKLGWDAPQSARVGEQFTVALTATAPTPLASAAVSLKFDPGVLEVVKVEEGNLLKQGNAATRANHTLDSIGGRLAIGVARSEGDGAQGEGRLFNVTYRVKAPSARSQILLNSMSLLGPNSATIPFSASGPLTLTLQP
jgi:general secretion pathway protein D